ncbi:T9SS type A sorting domain-containing protein [Lewinella sp. IMCC34183]|uniref:T9SS type A sorting domain-containing protein n=1 Tax=Lewinella sp. IMCC34183 TaxID=2248762 RepID=UPI000E243CFD|nr:T9SS type A sorting domain-containing protein [Lewinella sp. IMCC34183]
MSLTRAFLCSLLLAGLTSGVGAQITLGRAYFPVVGDSLLTNQATDAYREGIVFQPPGEALTWDFGFPDLRTEYTEVLEAVVADTLFPTAEMRLTSAAFDYEYYRSTDTTFELVGLVGSLPFFRDEVFAAALVPPRAVRRAGISYGDSFSSTSVREIRISVDSLPADIRTSDIGSALRSYDSVRVTSTSIISDVVDAYGSLTLEGDTYTVLREKRVEIMDTRVYVKAGQSAYLDVTGIVRAADPSTEAYLGRQPEEGTYYFWAEGEKEPVVEIEFDAEERPTTFLYKRGGKTTAVHRPDPSVANVELYPNPATEEATLTYRMLRPGRIAVELRDAAGRRVGSWPAAERGAGTHRITAPLVDLPNGMYYFELATEAGKTLRKLIKQ